MNDENESICENCSRTYEGEPQKCEECGMDGLGECCIATCDHVCEDGAS